MDRRIEGAMDGWMNGRLSDGCMHGRLYRWMDG